MSATSLILTVGGAIVGTISLAVTAASVAAVLAGIGIICNSAYVPISLASFAMCFQTGGDFISSKKDLLSYLIGVQQTFSVGKGSNNEEIKIMRYRYRFDGTGNDCYLNWSPYYLSSDYNFYNDDYMIWQIEHSGIDGLVHGFDSYEKIADLLNK